MSAPTYDGLPPEAYAALLTGNVEDYHDDDGRPIGEVRASPTARAGVVTRHGTCPWPGSRKDHALPMNLTALRQTTRDWTAILGALDWVRSAYLRREPTFEPNLLDYWRFVATQALLPAFLVFRTDDPKGEGQVPAFAGSINKMLGGVMSVCSKLALDEILAGRALGALRVTPELVATHAETHGGLIGAHEVCAGPAPMLDEVLQVLSFGTPNANHDAVRALVPDPGPFLDYAEAAVELTLLLFVVALEYGATFAEVDAMDLGRWTRASSATDPVFLGRLTSGLGVDPAMGHAAAVALTPLLRVDATALVDAPRLPEAAMIARSWELDPDPTVALALAELFAVHLRRERNTLRMVAELRGRIHAALGRPAPPNDLTGADLSALFGRTPTDLLADTLGVRIHNSPEATVFQVPGQSLQIPTDVGHAVSP